jgi:hypothetical protein
MRVQEQLLGCHKRDRLLLPPSISVRPSSSVLLGCHRIRFSCLESCSLILSLLGSTCRSFAYNEEGILLRALPTQCEYGIVNSNEEKEVLEEPPIFECNASCSCSISCGNRVIQRGMNCSIEIGSTSNRGWGVFARERIKTGTFVGEVRTRSD